MLLHALGLLAALGAATFATSATGRWSRWALPVGFVVAARWLQPDPVWTGGCVALAAAARLANPRLGPLTAVTAGILAGLWSSVLRSQGLPLVPALGLAAAVPAVSAWMTARRAGFAPRALKEEGAAWMCVLGLLVAVGPDVAAGWRSAIVLNLEPGSGTSAVFEVWVVVLSALSVIVGGVFTLWRRR